MFVVGSSPDQASPVPSQQDKQQTAAPPFWHFSFASSSPSPPAEALAPEADFSLRADALRAGTVLRDTPPTFPCRKAGAPQSLLCRVLNKWRMLGGAPTSLARDHSPSTCPGGQPAEATNLFPW